MAQLGIEAICGGSGAIEAWGCLRPLLKQWDDADPDGATFRYSRTSGGDIVAIDTNVYSGRVVEIWKEAMSVLHYFLDIALDGHLEMEAERRQADLEAREAYREEYETERYE